MKTHHSYRKRSRPISLLGNHSGTGKSLAGPNAIQLLRLEESVNQSSRVQRLVTLQRKAKSIIIPKTVFQLSPQNRYFKYDHSAYVPSKKARIHVHTPPEAHKKLKGQLNHGGANIRINSYFSALHALKTLQANPGVPGFDEMECILKGWLDDFSPATASVTQEAPVKKKLEHGAVEKEVEGQK